MITAIFPFPPTTMCVPHFFNLTLFCLFLLLQFDSFYFPAYLLHNFVLLKRFYETNQM